MANGRLNSGIRETDWLGVDVSKGRFDTGYARSDQHFPSTPLRDLPFTSFDRTSKGAELFLDWVDEIAPGREVRVVMEATGPYSTELAGWLLELRPSLAPAIENPLKARAFMDSLNQRNRTDGIAARALAFYGVERRPAPYEPLSKSREELRELSRHRETLVEERTALKNRMKEESSSKCVNAARERHLRHLDREIETAAQKMRRVVKKDEAFTRDVGLLTSIDGVGFITAATIVAEIGDLRRFERARQLTAFAGVSPKVVESGTSVRGVTRMCKRGNQRIRRVLYLAAMASLTTKRSNTLNAMHRRLCENGKTGKSALGALMRKLLTIMRAVLISGKPYDPTFKKGGKHDLQPTTCDAKIA